MARSYAKLLTSIWRDDDFKALDRNAQWLYLLLISQPDVSAAGVLPIRFSKWARMASDADIDGIEASFERLVADRFVIVDRDTEEALIRSFIRHDGGATHPNFHKAIVTAISNIESAALQSVARTELDIAAATKPSEPEPDGIDTASERERHSSSQQPAPSASTSSQQPARNGHTIATPPPGDPAAAATEMLVQHRLTTLTPDNPRRYAAKIRRNIPTEHPTLATAEPPDDCDDPARWIAINNLLGLTNSQAITAASNLRRNGGTAT